MKSKTKYIVSNTFEIFGDPVPTEFSTLAAAEKEADLVANQIADMSIEMDWFPEPDDDLCYHSRLGFQKESEFTLRWEGRDLIKNRREFVADIRESAVEIREVTCPQ